MSSSAPQRQAVPEASAFTYAEADAPPGDTGSSPNAGQAAEERSRRQQAETFEQGRQSAQLQFRAELDAALVKHRDQISHALHEFGVERQNYYRRVEGEVVELALAVARKILHREAQLDANVLAGIVRITLEKLDTATSVKLYVSPKEADDWRHYFACRMEDVPAPDIHEDPAIPPGECRIETSLGSTHLGLELQLKEIETGLLDLLAERPGAAPPAASNAAKSNQAPESR
ncbi:MAG: FliH/SctL family protein [Terriglobales bacterium]